MWSMAGQRRWRWQLGTGSDRTSGVAWWRRGCWPVHRDASRAGLSFPECPDCAGITWPQQYVPSHRAFFSTIAALLVYIVCVMQTHTSCSLYHFSASPCVRCVEFVNIHSLVCVFNCVWSFFLSCQGFCLLKCKRTWGRQQITLWNTSTNLSKRYAPAIVSVSHRNGSFIHLTLWL